MLRLLIETALFSLLAGCAATHDAPRQAISAGKWTVVEASFEIPAGATPTLEFNAGRLSAHSGCNRASGPYKEVGGKLETGPLLSTKMSCGSARDRLESNYYGLLSANPAYTIEGDFLTLSAGSNRARFKRSN